MAGEFPQSRNVLSRGFNDVTGTLNAQAAGNGQFKYLTGSRAIIKVNGKLAGFAFAANINIQTDQRDVNEIDNYVPYELAPRRTTVTGTLGMFHIPGKGPTAEGYMGNVLSFLMKRYVTIEIRDRTTNNLIFKTDRAAITGRQQSIMAGEQSTITLSFRAIDWEDEVEPKKPSNVDEEKE